MSSPAPAERSVGSRRKPLRACTDLPLGPEAAALARRTVVDVVRSWQLAGEDWLYDVRLVTSELVSNAVRHGGVVISLEIELDSTGVTISVSDGNSVLPEPRSAGDEEEGGRGFALVDATTLDWGVTQEASGGKRVWARLPLP